LRSIDLKALRASMPSSPSASDIVPIDIEVTSDGNAMILDRSNSRVIILDRKFAPIRSIGVPAGAVDLALSRDGHDLYVLDQPGCQIRAFNLAGEQLFSWGKPGTNAGEFYNPSGMTAGSDGFVYVTDGTDRIEKFDERGVFVAQWGRRGVGAREFFKPRGIAQDDQARLFIADWGNHRVQVFGSQGEYRGTFGAALYVRRAKHEQD
jgi:DNA-binding beta-propeller fold protein YncE